MGEKKIQGAILFCPGESLQVIILKPKSNALPRGALLPQILKGQIKRILQSFQEPLKRLQWHSGREMAGQWQRKGGEICKQCHQEVRILVNIISWVS